MQYQEESLHTHYYKDINLEHLAQQFYISQETVFSNITHFNRVFKLVTGMISLAKE